MTDFTASNGITIRERDDTTPVLEWNADGRYCTDGSRWYAVGEGIDGADPGFTADSPVARALRELWQRERDEELGRWRWPENPEYVAYRRDAYPGDKRRVRVIHEPDGDFVDTVEGSILDGIFKDAARAYFESHPERKPWEDAKDGDIWEFSLGCSSGQYLADSGRFFLLPLRAPSDPGWKPASFANDFEHGRRIWPEDAS